LSEGADSRDSGWTALKVIGVILSSIAMLGFGALGMCGLVLAGYGAEILGLALAALLAAGASLAIMVWIVRSADRDRS